MSFGITWATLILVLVPVNHHEPTYPERFQNAVIAVLNTVSDKNSVAPAIAKLKLLRKEALDAWPQRVVERKRIAERAKDVPVKVTHLRTNPPQQEGQSPAQTVTAKSPDAHVAQMVFENEIYRMNSLQGGAAIRQEVQAIFLALECGCESDDTLARPTQPKREVETAQALLPEFTIQKEEGVYTIRAKSNRKLVYSGFQAPLVARGKDLIFLEDNGVCAIDLKTSETLWHVRLFANGPFTTFFILSKPLRRHDGVLTFETDGKRVFVHGRNGDGEYVEHLDAKTGKILTNRRFDSDPVLPMP